MKKIICMIAIACIAKVACAQNIGIGTSTPNASAALEIKASNKGLLIPRTSTASRNAIASPAKGLLVYDTSTSSFWYRNGSAWVQVENSGKNWSLTGNAGTTNENNFLGTTDKRSLQFKVNNIYAGAIDTLNNVFIGTNAGQLNQSVGSVAIGNGAFTTAKGGEIVAIGINSFSSNVNGIWNTAVGSYSLAAHKTGNLNTAIGYAALDHDTAGASNSAVGAFALSANKSGFNNNAFGSYVLGNNDSGSYNTGAGSGALFSNTGGHQNSAFGRRTLYNNINGFSNVAVGSSALFTDPRPRNLVAIGDSALYNNVTDPINVGGHSNTAIGSKSLYTNNIGYQNTAIGFRSLYYNQSGFSNSAVGWTALGNNTLGTANTAVGNQSLSLNATGNYNTAIGFNANVALDNLTNATAIGAYALATASNSIQLGNSDITNVNTYGNITVQNGKGLIRSTDGTQLKKQSVTVTVNVIIGSGGTANIPFSFPESFGDTPDVYIGNITGGGGFAEVIMSVANVSASGGSLFVNNPRSGLYEPNFSIKIIAIGPQ